MGGLDPGPAKMSPTSRTRRPASGPLTPRRNRLAAKWLPYNDVLLRTGTLDPRLRELVICRVGWRTAAEYEWLQHVRLARDLGVTDAEIDAIAGRGTVEWTPLEADALAATDALLDGYEIPDALWNRLAERLDEQQRIELVFVVGTYTCLAMAFKSFGVQLDADLVDYPAPRVSEDTGVVADVPVAMRGGMVHTQENPAT
jgi:alkylhydroperoxidase family enzyme